MALPPLSPTSTALVTGASSGIGTELATELARRGHGVTLAARREVRLQTLAGELHRAHGVRTEVVAFDVTDPEARQRALGTISSRGLSVDVLVNNAGFSTSGPVHHADPAREVDLVRTDVEAVVALCTSCLPDMVRRGRGAVLNVASTAAFQPLPGQAAYGAAKAFVLSYSQALQGELRGSGVSVTALCPGPVRTEFAVTAGFTEEEAHGSLPSFMWLSAAAVARAAVEGLARGRPVVIPGAANRVAAQIAHKAPRRVLVPMLARQHPALKKPPQ